MKKSKVIWVWVLAYFVVTLVGVGHTCFNWLVLGMENAGPVQSMYDIVPYAATVPYHALYNIILWPLFAVLCLKGQPRVHLMKDAVILGGVWALLSILIDLVGWVAIPHPWAMTWMEFYVDYQPWITLIYLSIFVSPIITALFMRRRKGNAAS